MTIRTRLTCWYAGVLLSSLLLMGGVLYYELVLEPVKVAQAGEPKEPMEEEIAEILLFYGAPTVLLTILGGWWLLNKALSPLDRLASAAERIHMHNLHEPLPRTGNGDEIDRLSVILNAKNQRLEEAINQIQEFTLNASHELKTPLAILHGEIESSLNEPTISTNQREAFASQLDEIQRLAKIVEALTLLAKADAGKLVLKQELVRLDDLVRESFADGQILAQQKGITVDLEECEEATIQGDRHRLRQLLLNLMDNAIKYNKQNGHVTIALETKGNLSEVTITNTGRGIPEAHLNRIFDRFFRGDESHSSVVDGSGLGLSIAEWIVKGHKGEIVITSDPGKLTTVKVSFPPTRNPAPIKGSSMDKPEQATVTPGPLSEALVLTKKTDYSI